MIGINSFSLFFLVFVSFFAFIFRTSLSIWGTGKIEREFLTNKCMWVLCGVCVCAPHSNYNIENRLALGLTLMARLQHQYQSNSTCRKWFWKIVWRWLLFSVCSRWKLQMSRPTYAAGGYYIKHIFPSIPCECAYAGNKNASIKQNTFLKPPKQHRDPASDCGHKPLLILTFIIEALKNCLGFST